MASGDTLLVLLPQSNEPPATVYANYNTRNAILVLEFDPSTIWSSVFRGVLPSNYAGGGLTFDLYWMAGTATSGNVVWGVSLERNNAANHDLDSDNFATEQTATGAADGTSGKLTKTTITVSSGANMDSATTNDPVRVRIRRVANDGSDTMSGLAQLFAVECKET